MQRTLQKSPRSQHQQTGVDCLGRIEPDELTGTAGKQMGVDFQVYPRQVPFIFLRTDDAIKNKFFSKYRKAVRNINMLKCKYKNSKTK